MSNVDRSWMYRRLMPDGFINLEFAEGVQSFIEYASSQPAYMDGQKIRCPCKKCKHIRFLPTDEVHLHLLKKGFVPNYFEWTRHGEPIICSTSRGNQVYSSVNIDGSEGGSGIGQNSVDVNENLYAQMVHDVAGHSFQENMQNIEEEPNPNAKRFFDLLESADQELWPNCEKMTQLSAIARILNIKSEGHISERSLDKILTWYNDSLPPDHKMVENFYEMKKLIRGLGLPVERIDCCRLGCMLFWGEDVGLQECKYCGQPRFKPRKRTRTQKLVPWKRMYYFPLTPRLQRLYASDVTASHMRWHNEHEQSDGSMSHPSDAIAWKHFNDIHTEFASESRNVRLGLSTDGFQPFGQSGQQYSSWPIIITPYNLPPWMCMDEAYMFLTVIVPGPTNPKHKIDVFLQPLISELNHLWEFGVQTYDVSLKQNFQMKAALMWTVSDFPAYAMLSGWSTAGKLACPYCGNDSDAFYLPNGGKTSWFDNHRKFLPLDHPFRRNKQKFIKNRVVQTPPPPNKSGEDILREIDQLGLLKVTELESEEVNSSISQNFGWRKRSIFWDLPYWKTLLIRHNLDVMHIEKNIFDNLFNTIMNIEGRTKDNAKSRADLKIFCRRSELDQDPNTGKYPKACYTLDKKQKQVLCEWLKSLKFPDGYVSNLARCVDMRKYKLFGMKSHDCHVFMQRLIPIAFRELLPNNVWEAITELSLFFKSLTASEIHLSDMERLERDIPVILCKLEAIFPPSFFDYMEHLPIHLVHEARLAGPVQYRWMYPFERNLHHLKQNVKNKARVEGSICNAYLVEEASTFCSHYFEPHVITRERKVPRNDDGGVRIDDDNLSIFKYPGRPHGYSTRRMLTEKEMEAAHGYILLNCQEIQSFLHEYEDLLRELMPGKSQDDINKEVDKNFPRWFANYASENRIQNRLMCDLAKGPLRTVKSYPVYFVNGYKFHTENHGHSMATVNSRVCIQGELMDYFGKIIEILEIEYPALPIKRCVLFKCEWFDPTPSVGTKVHSRYNLTEINQRRRFKQFEPFVLEMQATQVYYVPYPSLRRDKSDWLAVVKVKQRGVFHRQAKGDSKTNESEAFQEEEVDVHEINVCLENEVLNYPNNDFVEILSGEEEESVDGQNSEDETDFNSEFSETEDDFDVQLSDDSI